MNPRPSQICGELLAALDASEGRRRRRKRDTTPDAIGLTIKRDLLERAVAADPEPDAFEAWLHEQCLAAGRSEGGVRAMALSILRSGAWRTTRTRSGTGWLAEPRRTTHFLMKGPPPVASKGKRCTSLCACGLHFSAALSLRPWPAAVAPAGGRGLLPARRRKS